MPRLLSRVNFPKLMVVFTIAFVVALGACGLNILTGSGSRDFRVDSGLLELAVMLLSAVGLFLTAIVWLVVAMIGDRGAPGTLPLPDRKDDRES